MEFRRRTHSWPFWLKCSPSAFLPPLVFATHPPSSGGAVLALPGRYAVSACPPASHSPIVAIEHGGWQNMKKHVFHLHALRPRSITLLCCRSPKVIRHNGVSTEYSPRGPFGSRFTPSAPSTTFVLPPTHPTVVVRCLYSRGGMPSVHAPRRVIFSIGATALWVVNMWKKSMVAIYKP